ncbi:hypothetical protein HNI00_18095 [Thermoleptolyngbya oregonensis NK1-22]|jgi:hypothetical protein|uniref:Uncharacterized protein n=1 Tax=Thermoleptolyngbya oregonensis NK1-22 TaxID=2547457 RepID=A0AA96Y6B3_9CYAN|nr:hypothetical protein [Thermoleptolyngbya oregonensis]WOB44850.1 hypothetical protein HNI00_18095 [Thermoleptolyngbya oregonensis NK1-22]
MKPLLFKAVILLPVLCLTSLFSIGWVAFPAIAQTLQGRGQIVSGPGQGSVVQISLTINGNQVTFHSGPSQGQTAQIQNGVARTPDGNVWQFAQGRRQVTLYSGNRVIVYVLR